MQIKKKVDLTQPENEFERALAIELQKYSQDLSDLLNGGLKFSDNFNAEITTVSDSGTADTEFTVSHTLKRVPSGFIVINISKGGVVYDSGTDWTTTDIYLKCTTANTEVKLLIF